MVFACIVGLAWAVQLAEPPAALRAFEESRKSLFSGRVVWTSESKRQHPGRKFNYISRYALNGDRIFEQRGDQEGWTRFEGPEYKPYSKFPQLWLLTDTDVWRHSETSTSFDWWKINPDDPLPGAIQPPNPDELPDIRHVGIMFSSYLQFRYGTDCFWGAHLAAQNRPDAALPSMEWRVQKRGGKYEVSARLPDALITWIIDPDKGWNAERITATSPTDSLKREVICSLKSFDGVWFPENVVYLVNGEVDETYTVLSASFNKPDDPARFTPADLGMEAGFNVNQQNFRVPAKPGVPMSDVLIWDGEKPIDFPTWRDLVKSGARQPGPMLQERKRTGRRDSPYLTDEQRARRDQHMQEMNLRMLREAPLSRWERYVEDFIRRYSLDEEQTQRARGLLRDCQKQGGEYLDRRKADFQKLQSERTAARKENNADALRKTDERLAELRKPVDEIFENKLKPRLEKIPTQRQREAAAAAEAARAAAAAANPEKQNEPPKEGAEAKNKQGHSIP